MRPSLVALSLTLSLSTAAAQVLPHAPTTDHLPNGLTLVTVPYDAPGIAAYFTLVRTGSRDEVEPGHSGFAHLFEHMMFRGTQTIPAAEYERHMQRLGADNNAFTTEDFTLYTVTLPSTFVDELIPIEADRFQHLSYAVTEFQTETRAVLGEYNKNAASPLHAMWEALSELSFTRHTYGHTTMGYLRDIQAMPGYYAYARRFFSRFYTPDNCTVIVAGDVDRAHLLEGVQRHYGAWTGHRDQPRIPAEPEPTAQRTQALAWQGSTPSRMFLGYRVPRFDLSTRDSVALEVVHALAFSESSDLYQRLVVRDPKLLGLESSQGDPHRDPGLFIVEATLREGTTFDEVTAAVDDALARIARGETDNARVQEVVSNLRYGLAMQVQTPSDAAELVARYMALTGEVDAYDRYHQALALVTPDDVARVARTWLVPARRATVTLSPADHAPPTARRVGPAPARRTP